MGVFPRRVSPEIQRALAMIQAPFECLRRTEPTSDTVVQRGSESARHVRDRIGVRNTQNNLPNHTQAPMPDSELIVVSRGRLDCAKKRLNFTLDKCRRFPITLPILSKIGRACSKRARASDDLAFSYPKTKAQLA